jgi:hypothetical protein
MNLRRCCIRRIDRSGIHAGIAKRLYVIRRLHMVDAAQASRNITGDGQYRSVIVPGLVQTGEKMCGSRSPCSRANAEPAGQFRLAGGGERSALFVPNTEPLQTVVATNGVRERVQRISHDAEDLRDAQIRQCRRQQFTHCSAHGGLLAWTQETIGRGEPWLSPWVDHCA